MNKQQQSGFTLIEMLVVVAIIAVLVAMSLPNTMGIIRSHRSAATKNLIRNALAQAQAHAAVTQKYAGVRFQQSASGRQYIVLIESNSNVKIIAPSFAPWPLYQLIDRFVAVDNAKATAMPTGFVAMQGDIIDDFDLDGNAKLWEKATFSIIFSPTGQLVTKRCQCLPRLAPNDHLIPQADYELENDGIFCAPADAAEEGPPLARDEIADAWTDMVELSMGGMYLCEWDPLDKEEIPTDARWSGYLNRYRSEERVEYVLINIYTGTIIKEEL
ncbi:MAG: prepilin-type N-terminal cleavage/methylation domain-containing protein [Sedimentisphaerales bacterium]|nr:prepilin-type N-terminal cleavage/methylation domain-containing protein [Sedimentisphaerales bacterium]